MEDFFVAQDVFHNTGVTGKFACCTENKLVEISSSLKQPE